MKKLSFLLMALVLSATLLAQDTASRGNKSGMPGRFGVYGGVNIANIGGDSQSYDQSLTGYQFGFMFCAFTIGHNLECWLEPGYNAIGSKYNDTYNSQTYSGSVNLGYIMLPVMLKYNTNLGIFGEIGLQPQYLVSAKDKYEGRTDDYKQYVNAFDFGVPVGVGYEFRKKVGIGARYNYGLTNINKKNNYDNSKDHNTVLSFRLYFRF